MTTQHGRYIPIAYAPALNAGDGDRILDASSNVSSYGEDTEELHVDKSWQMLHEVELYGERQLNDGFIDRRLGVTWNNLSIEGVGSDQAVQENLLSQLNIPQKVKESRGPKCSLKIIQDSFGCVHPGEMLLVLGRPGAGCTSLLKVLSNRRAEFEKVTGSVHYGSMTAKEAEQFRGQIVMNTEEELFFPHVDRQTNY